MQQVLSARNNFIELDQWMVEKGIRRIFLVCDPMVIHLKIYQWITELENRKGIVVEKFDGFQPNPLYESVVRGTSAFRESGCDMIMAVGGGSAMDVAKCIKLYAEMDPDVLYLDQPIVPNSIPFLAMPTTAGTGSEATRYAVIYYQGEKQSIADYSCIPETVLFDPSVLETLSDYQKKATMMDAFCHAIESMWSVNSTEESKQYADQAIRMIMQNKDGYLQNDLQCRIAMLEAANLAGKAINITQTTAGHAMCYKLTSLYRISHGHAALLCIKELLPFMIKHTDQCIDPRGQEYLEKAFAKIADSMGCQDIREAADRISNLAEELKFSIPEARETDIQTLKTSVNPIRLKNNPVGLKEENIEAMYRHMLLI